jgi:hypothetical protein
VAFVADPATGAWVADPYNLGSSQPFEVVGGTSLGAPSWAGLVALVNQGRANAAQPALNSASPTETQQALYSLGQSDYHVIASSTNGGYNAAPGYNLVTGLGTPVANLLVPDLVTGNYPATGRVAPIAPDLNANPGWSGSGGGGGFNAMAVRGQGSRVGEQAEVRSQRSNVREQNSEVRDQGARLSDGRDLGGVESDFSLGGMPATAGAEAESSSAEWRASDRTAAMESASDLVFVSYESTDVGQDTDTDQWIGALERSDDVLDVYREAFQTVLEGWQGL